MGISRITAYEIAGNPDDIVVDVNGPDENGKFAGVITRGPGHNYKLLIETNYGYDDEEAAKSDMEQLIETVKRWVVKDLRGSDNPLNKMGEEEKRVVGAIVSAAKK